MSRSSVLSTNGHCFSATGGRSKVSCGFGARWHHIVNLSFGDVGLVCPVKQARSAALGDRRTQSHTFAHVLLSFKNSSGLALLAQASPPGLHRRAGPPQAPISNFWEEKVTLSIYVNYEKKQNLLDLLG